MNDEAARVWRAMRRLVIEGKDGQREVCRALDLSYVKVRALSELADRSMTHGALAAALQIDAPYTSVIIADLEQRGLVVRAPNPDDGRSKLISATPAGRRTARVADAALGEPPASVRALSARDLATLDRITAALLVAQAQG